jgi:hypothetical protein
LRKHYVRSAHCETTANLLQEYMAGVAKSVRIHCIHVAETLLSSCRKLTRDGHFNCDARAGAFACALRKHGVRVTKQLQTCCRNTSRARESDFETMAYTLQRSGEPVAKVHCRRSGFLLRRASSSAALTIKCDFKTRIRTYVSHGSATSDI